MIYSENAPDLESALHELLEGHRINLVNPRKEFFHVPLGEIEDFAKKRGLKVEFTMLAEAREYRETISMRAQEQVSETPALDTFPANLFSNSDAQDDAAHRNA
jgi:hypothetical protein